MLPLAILGVVIGGAGAAVALAIDWLPDPAAKEADRVDTLIWWTIFASLFIFTIVCMFLFYSVWKFRVGDDDDEDGPPNHGNTILEVIWTTVPAIMLSFTAAWGAVVLVQNEDIATASGGPLRIDVTAQQFEWDFTYKDGFTSGDMAVPVDRQVVLHLRAIDVIHSFFVYETRIKGDAVPGIVNDRVRFTMKPEYAGKVYPIVCTELCGTGHSVMRSRLLVMTQPDYDAWIAKNAAQAKQKATP